MGKSCIPDTQEATRRRVTVPRDTARSFPLSRKAKYRLPVSQQRDVTLWPHRGGTLTAAPRCTPAPLSAA
ncbi:hypothetical protein KCP70_17425 [Salmonella enterica subsp. enterica]|nr:hypothetical protein KCP70_17425 [Salmonella enterica subsp. enterica]